MAAQALRHGGELAGTRAIEAEVRLYDRLFTEEEPESVSAKAGAEFTTLLNPASLETLTTCQVEPMLGAAPAGARFQFEGLGYFAADPDGAPGRPVFNRTVALRDTWAKVSSTG